MPQLVPGNSLGFLLTDVARLFRQGFDREVERTGIELTSGEIRTLAFVARFPGSRQAILAERMGIEPMTLSAYIDRLEARGLLNRTQDPSDRRAKNVNVSSTAEAVFARVRPLALGIYETALGDITPAEAEIVNRVLLQMRANLAVDPDLRAEAG